MMLIKASNVKPYEIILGAVKKEKITIQKRMWFNALYLKIFVVVIYSGSKNIFFAGAYKNTLLMQ